MPIVVRSTGLRGNPHGPVGTSAKTFRCTVPRELLVRRDTRTRILDCSYSPKPDSDFVFRRVCHEPRAHNRSGDRELRRVWMGNNDHRQPIDAGEVLRVAGEERQVVGQGDRGDHRVVGPARPAFDRSAAARPPRVRRHERPRRRMGVARSPPRPAGGGPGARSAPASVVATSGPTVNSASVMVEMSGWLGRTEASRSRLSRISVLVSSRPASGGFTGTGQASSRCLAAEPQDQAAAAGASDPAASRTPAPVVGAAEVPPPPCRTASPSGAHRPPRDRLLRRRGSEGRGS